MTLMKFSPAREMFPKHFSHLFDSLMSERESNSHTFFQPRTDVLEKENSFEIQISLPGLKKEDIKIDLKNKQLMVSGERKLNREEKNTRYHVLESAYGNFTRSFTLPETVNSEAIDAKFEDGVLYLSLPKKEDAGSTSISIK